MAMSRTCTMTSASRTSSSVARKDIISSCGRSEMTPTVSDKMTSRPPGSLMRRMVGSSVANSRFSANTPAEDRQLNKVDLPALV